MKPWAIPDLDYVLGEQVLLKAGHIGAPGSPSSYFYPVDFPPLNKGTPVPGASEYYDNIIDGSDIRVGHQIIGLASNGLHSNGYSLVRRLIFKELGLSLDDTIPGCDCTVAEELLRPTRIYAETVQVILRDFPVSGMAHITGGGLYDNLNRILPRACQANIWKGSWQVPSIFPFLQRSGNISDYEMHRVFNNGIGFVLVVPTANLEDTLELLGGLGEQAFHIGVVDNRAEEDSPPVLIE